MLRVFNKKWKRHIEAEVDPNDFMILQAFAFADVPEKYTGDITFRLGVKAGDIEIIETRKQAAAFESDPKAETAEADEVTEKPARKARAKKGEGK